jgi:hypothetical protein
MQEAAIGRIIYFDANNRRGVIAPQNIASQQNIPGELYFKVDEAQALALRVGQLVRFLVENDKAVDIAVLSQSA